MLLDGHLQGGAKSSWAGQRVWAKWAQPSGNKGNTHWLETTRGLGALLCALALGTVLAGAVPLGQLALMLCYVISAPRLCWQEYLAPGI